LEISPFAKRFRNFSQSSADVSIVTAAAIPSGQPCAAAPPKLLSVWRFFALNTEVKFFACDWTGSAAFPSAERVFHEGEARFSRFRPTSELSMLNTRVGSEVSVSRELFRLLELCQRYHRLSGGLFEPGILPHLEAAGYDRSFDLVPREDGARTTAAPVPVESIEHIVLDHQRRTVRLPKSVRIDLGGIGKGYIVDEAASVLAPGRDFLIDAGGDIYASGEGGEGPGWLVGVADPRDTGHNLTTVWLRDQALATSTTTRRNWKRAGQALNHLIDPRTLLPINGDVASVSVVARRATDADVFAKVALLKGVENGARFLDEQSAGGLFVLEDSSWMTTKHWTGGTA
jgi:thiamine biosynthesis lipoprotein